MHKGNIDNDNTLRYFTAVFSGVGTLFIRLESSGIVVGAAVAKTTG